MRARLLGVLALLAGCITPSLPLPPPSPALVVFAVDPVAQTATFRCDRTEFLNATVYVFDRTTGRGVITTANPDGSVDETPPFSARDGDRIFVTFETEDQSAGLCLILQDGRSSELLKCP